MKFCRDYYEVGLFPVRETEIKFFPVYPKAVFTVTLQAFALRQYGHAMRIVFVYCFRDAKPDSPRPRDQNGIYFHGINLSL